MRLSDARKILSGEYEPYGSNRLWVNRKVGKYETKIPVNVPLTQSDIEFCLRQLATKVVAEKGKGK